MTDIPLPAGWTRVECDDGPVYSDGQVTTAYRCPRCGKPFVPRSCKQHTCGAKRCQWSERETNPARKAQKLARFDEWIKEPENRKRHTKSVLEARARRKVAKKIAAKLEAIGTSVKASSLYGCGLAPADRMYTALAAMWYTFGITVDGDQVSLATKSARFLRMPPSRVEVPPVLHPPVLASLSVELTGKATILASPTDPWTIEAPAFGTHLPGAALPIHCRRGVLPLDQARRLHGAITQILGTGHNPRVPDFTLIQTDRSVASLGWGLYLRDEDKARNVAGTAHAIRIGESESEIRFGSLLRFKAPPAPTPGRHRMRLDTLTPVVIRNHIGTVERVYQQPTARAIASTLVEVARRLGAPVVLEDLAVRMVSQHTEHAAVRLGKIGGPSGCVRGWSGSVVVDVSAPARWLLDCAARMGLGGHVAFGFGRVAVREEPVPEAEPAPPRVLLAGVSSEAVKAYAGRHRITEDKAHACLLDATDCATFTSEHDGGIEVWSSEHERLVVVRRDRHPIVVRVVGEGEALRIEDLQAIGQEKATALAAELKLAGQDEGSIAGKWFVTGHAARRFAQHALGWTGGEDDALPEVLYKRALTEIIRDSEAAHVVRACTPRSGSPEAVVWRGPKPRRLRYIVAAKPLDGYQVAGLMTVLPEYDRRRATA